MSEHGRWARPRGAVLKTAKLLAAMAAASGMLNGKPIVRLWQLGQNLTAIVRNCREFISRDSSRTEGCLHCAPVEEWTC
jgi:hypothetical protein